MAFFTNLLAMMRKPYYGNVPYFPAGQDLSWIPDGGTNLATEYAVEAPDGRVAVAGNTFTFTSIPKYLIYNGTLLKAVIDFSGGPIVTIPASLSVGDELYAIV
jgi:hypothetical protein